jgi:hypothetical protein
MYYMSPSDSQSLKRRDLNDKSHVLNLPTGAKIYVRSRLYNKNRKIRSYTLFFRLDGILSTNRLIKKTIEPVSTEKTA